jgi:hypothetical protein
MLSQFMDIEPVFLEVKRVLQPGRIFVFLEEPIRRSLSLRLYRCPYYDTMKPWERKLFDWGLLGFLVKDVIGAHQEESFGIRQNHRMGLSDWHRLINKHFIAYECERFVPCRGWGESLTHDVARIIDRDGSQALIARLLGGTLAAFCRKEGKAEAVEPMGDRFERYLVCPDCLGGLERNENYTLRCQRCGYEAPNEGGVYNLLQSVDRKELYPGDRADVADFSRPNHERHLVDGFYELEGFHGNKYRWIGERARVRLRRVDRGQQLLRIRGFAHEYFLSAGSVPRIEVAVNGGRTGVWTLDRIGSFILEAKVPEADEYLVEILAKPVWTTPSDDRQFTVNVSMIRLVSQGGKAVDLGSTSCSSCSCG